MTIPELEPFADLFRVAGWEPAAVLAPGTAHVLADGHRLVSQQSAPGIHVTAQANENGIAADIIIAQEAKLVQPVHLCFGLFDRYGVQDIHLSLTLERGAQATVWSHCLFAMPERARHAMNGEIRIMQAAALIYQEAHYHGLSGGIEVLPRARVTLEKGARYLADFALIQGRVGRLDIDYDVDVGEEAVAELTSRVYGFGADSIRIRERLNLHGIRARGLIKSRVAVCDQARAEVVGITEGNAAGARGHVDCLEIVRDQAVVSAIPEVRVSHPEAKVTHEAAIGSVDSKQLETLMARGLDPDAAVDVIVRGMLG